MSDPLSAFLSGLSGALGAPMLPLLPGLLAWALLAARAGSRFAAPGFAAGFGIGFAALNMVDGALVAAADAGALVAGAMIAAFGLHGMKAIRVPGAAWLAAPLGFAFAFGWSPLPSAALANAVETGTFATAIYGAGLAIFAWLANPILGSVLRGNFSGVSPGMRRIEIVAGLTLFATGLAIAGGLLAEAGFALDEYFPALKSFG